MKGRLCAIRSPLRALLLLAGTVALPALAQDPGTAPPRRLVAAEAPKGTVTATVDMGAEFPAMQGYVYTQTLTTVAPGTGRAWHSHKDLPEIVRIVSGVLTDARNGGEAKAYGPGSTLVNAGGTEHMWANLGTEPVVFIATAIRARQ
jgi:quercetin dioxygenase-like cupin family protein